MPSLDDACDHEPDPEEEAERDPEVEEGAAFETFSNKAEREEVPSHGGVAAGERFLRVVARVEIGVPEGAVGVFAAKIFCLFGAGSAPKFFEKSVCQDTGANDEGEGNRAGGFAPLLPAWAEEGEGEEEGGKRSSGEAEDLAVVVHDVEKEVVVEARFGGVEEAGGGKVEVGREGGEASKEDEGQKPVTIRHAENDKLTWILGPLKTCERKLGAVIGVGY